MYIKISKLEKWFRTRLQFFFNKETNSIAELLSHILWTYSETRHKHITNLKLIVQNNFNSKLVKQIQINDKLK
jgi:hypothetical protein